MRPLAPLQIQHHRRLLPDQVHPPLDGLPVGHGLARLLRPHPPRPVSDRQPHQLPRRIDHRPPQRRPAPPGVPAAPAPRTDRRSAHRTAPPAAAAAASGSACSRPSTCSSSRCASSPYSRGPGRAGASESPGDRPRHILQSPGQRAPDQPLERWKATPSRPAPAGDATVTAGAGVTTGRGRTTVVRAGAEVHQARPLQLPAHPGTTSATPSDRPTAGAGGWRRRSPSVSGQASTSASRACISGRRQLSASMAIVRAGSGSLHPDRLQPLPLRPGEQHVLRTRRRPPREVPPHDRPRRPEDRPRPRHVGQPRLRPLPATRSIPPGPHTDCAARGGSAPPPPSAPTASASASICRASSSSDGTCTARRRAQPPSTSSRRAQRRHRQRLLPPAHRHQQLRHPPRDLPAPRLVDRPPAPPPARACHSAARRPGNLCNAPISGPATAPRNGPRIRRQQRMQVPDLHRLERRLQHQRQQPRRRRRRPIHPRPGQPMPPQRPVQHPIRPDDHDTRPACRKPPATPPPRPPDPAPHAAATGTAARPPLG